MEIYLPILLMCSGCLATGRKADAQDVTTILELQIKEINPLRDQHDSEGETVAEPAFSGFDRSGAAVLIEKVRVVNEKLVSN